MKRCERCGQPVDRGACGQTFSIVTVKDDRKNDPAKYKQRRFYLCDSCTFDLEIQFVKHFRLKLEEEDR